MTDISYRAGITKQINVVNCLTAARAFMFVPVVVSLYFDLAWMVVAWVIIAGLTDWCDGYLARRWGMLTPLGRVADPLADKLFINFALIPALIMHGDLALLALWVLVILYDADNTWQRRTEIARAFLNLPRDKPDLPATLWSKSKTALLFVLTTYCYVPDEWFRSEVLTLLAQLAIGAVVVAWVGNRKDVLQKLFG